MTNASPGNTADVSEQLLIEARELRNKQDSRLANIQHQSQLVVAGFLAIAAIVAAASAALDSNYVPPHQTDRPPFIIPLAAIVLISAAVNGVTWFSVHRIPRNWV